MKGGMGHDNDLEATLAPSAARLIFRMLIYHFREGMCTHPPTGTCEQLAPYED